MFGFEYFTGYLALLSFLVFLFFLWNYSLPQRIGTSLQTIHTTHNLLVQTSGTGILGHAWNFTKRYAQYRWVILRDRIMGNVTVHADGTTEVNYASNGRVYTYLVKPRKGPSPILAAFDDRSEFKTDYIISLYGPNRDWHGREYTAKALGCKSITLELPSGDSTTFSGSEVISVQN